MGGRRLNGHFPLVLVASLLASLVATPGARADDLWSGPGSAAAPIDAVGPGRARAFPLDPAERAYATALWAVHARVKLAAVRMTFAGITYKTTGSDAGQLTRAVLPLQSELEAAAVALVALPAPPSLDRVQAHYRNAVARYLAASETMVEGARVGDDTMLLEAQEASMAASEDLLRVGEVLWPGEHTPH